MRSPTQLVYAPGVLTHCQLTSGDSSFKRAWNRSSDSFVLLKPAAQRRAGRALEANHLLCAVGQQGTELDLKPFCRSSRARSYPTTSERLTSRREQGPLVPCSLD